MMLHAALIVCSLAFAGLWLAPQPRSESTVLRGVTMERAGEIDKAIEAAWRTRQPDGDVVWTLVRTPLFATEVWPTPKTIWTSYLAAYGMSIKGGLSDGQRVAEPWGRIDFDNGTRTFSLTLIGDRLIDSGKVQGVRPLTGASADVLNRAAEFRTWVLTHPQWPVFNDELRRLQQFYVVWTAGNGVLTEMIAPRHADFLKWVRVIVG